MSYWTKFFFGDKKIWTKLLIPGTGFLLMVDILSYIFKPPGYFNLWPLKITVFLAIPILIRIIYTNFHKLNKIKKVEAEAPVYEKNREREILEIIRSDPEFTTFCYDCIYFNEELSACGRDRIYERVKEIKIGLRQYCLYWDNESRIPVESGPDEI